MKHTHAPTQDALHEPTQAKPHAVQRRTLPTHRAQAARAYFGAAPVQRRPPKAGQQPAKVRDPKRKHIKQRTLGALHDEKRKRQQPTIDELIEQDFKNHLMGDGTDTIDNTIEQDFIRHLVTTTKTP